MPGKISSSAHVAFELFGVIFDGALIGQNLSLFTIYLLETSNDIFKNFAHILHHHIGVSHWLHNRILEFVISIPWWFGWMTLWIDNFSCGNSFSDNNSLAFSFLVFLIDFFTFLNKGFCSLAMVCRSVTILQMFSNGLGERWGVRSCSTPMENKLSELTPVGASWFSPELVELEVDPKINLSSPTSCSNGSCSRVAGWSPSPFGSTSSRIVCTKGEMIGTSTPWVNSSLGSTTSRVIGESIGPSTWAAASLLGSNTSRVSKM